MMEELLSKDVGVTSLLIFFIVGLLTKRFVPWWIYEEVLNKLKEYEQAAPALIEEMQKTMAMVRDPRNIESINVVAPRAKRVEIETRRRTPVKRKATDADLRRAARTLAKARKRLGTDE
jgi:hypothetical protein